jgi:signal transduction histidine kinase
VFGSLRFRLSVFFLGGIVLAGLLAAVISLVVFRDYTHSRTVATLRREAAGLASLYGQEAGRQAFSSRHLEQATGNRLYYAGLPLFPGQKARLRALPRSAVDWPRIQKGQVVQFTFTPPATTRRYLAVAQPVKLGSSVFGALVVATPEATLQSSTLRIMERLALAFAGGVLVAGAFGWYLSRRITKPVLSLARASDDVSEGKYDVEMPEVLSRDEIGHLADSFRRMAQRLAEADQLERNFLLTVSHELRTPLTAIRGHVDALREGVAESPQAQAASLEAVGAETARLERLVDDVLDLAKLNAHRFTVLHEEVDMGRLVDRAFTTFSEEAKRREIEYRCDIDARPVIVSDGDRVLQIISNLLQNAFRWTPDGGRVELSLDKENSSVAVAVSDSGPGIGDEERERIFRPFWTRDGAGTGLGLPISLELAHALGGDIGLESALGSGSRFTLHLPAETSSVYEAERRSSRR